MCGSTRPTVPRGGAREEANSAGISGPFGDDVGDNVSSEPAAIRQSRESFPLESQAEGPFRETTLHAYRWLSVMRPVAALCHLLFVRAGSRPGQFLIVAPSPRTIRCPNRKAILRLTTRAADGGRTFPAAVWAFSRHTAFKRGPRVPSRGSQPARHAKAPVATFPADSQRPPGGEDASDSDSASCEARGRKLPERANLPQTRKSRRHRSASASSASLPDAILRGP